jgi:hypothetical protein
VFEWYIYVDLSSLLRSSLLHRLSSFLRALLRREKELFAADVFFISLMSSLYLQSHLVNSPTEPWGGTPSTLCGMIHLIGKGSVSIGAMISHSKILFRRSWGVSLTDLKLRS